MATLQDFQSAGIEIKTEDFTEYTMGVQVKQTQYVVELPAGTTREQAEQMRYDGLTDNNYSDAGVRVEDRGGKFVMVIPQNQLEYIDSKEMTLFKDQYDQVKTAGKKVEEDKGMSGGGDFGADAVLEDVDAKLTKIAGDDPKVGAYADLVRKQYTGGELTAEEKQKMQDLQKDIGKDKVTEILKAAEPLAKTLDQDEKATGEKPKEELQKYEDGLTEEEKGKKKSKYEIIADMMGQGNFIGALLAMIFMPNDDNMTVGERIDKTQENAAKTASSPDASKEKGPDGKEPKEVDTTGLSEKGKDDIAMIKLRDDAEQKLAKAEKELEKAQAAFDKVNKKYGDRDLNDLKPAELKEFKDAEDKVQDAQGKVNKLEDNAAVYKTAKEKELEAELIEMKALKAQLKETQEKLIEAGGKSNEQQMLLDNITIDRDNAIKQREDAVKFGTGLQDKIQADENKAIDAKNNAAIPIPPAPSAPDVPAPPLNQNPVPLPKSQAQLDKELDELLAERKNIITNPQGVLRPNGNGTYTSIDALNQQDVEQKIRTYEGGGAAIKNQDKEIQFEQKLQRAAQGRAEAESRQQASQQDAARVAAAAEAAIREADALRAQQAEQKSQVKLDTQRAAFEQQEARAQAAGGLMQGMDRLGGAEGNTAGVKDQKLTEQELTFSGNGPADKAKFEELAKAMGAIDGKDGITLAEAAKALDAAGMKTQDVTEYAKNFNRAAKAVGSDKTIAL